MEIITQLNRIIGPFHNFLVWSGRARCPTVLESSAAAPGIPFWSTHKAVRVHTACFQLWPFWKSLIFKWAKLTLIMATELSFTQLTLSMMWKIFWSLNLIPSIHTFGEEDFWNFGIIGLFLAIKWVKMT